MPVRISGSPNVGLRAAIVLGVALTIAPTPVLAQVQVRGSSEAVTVEVRDASVEEVIATLSRTFGMDYHSPIDLDKRLYGTYVGPLSRVVMRILEGYSFVLRTDKEGVVITIVGTPQAPAAHAAVSALPASGDPRAPAPQPRQSGAAAPGSRAGVAVEPIMQGGGSRDGAREAAQEAIRG
jgi:hypothetical protein